MNKSSWVPAAVLAVSVLCAAAPASAATTAQPAATAQTAADPVTAAAQTAVGPVTATMRAVPAPTVAARAASPQVFPARGAVRAPLDITAGECAQGGGMITIIADGTVPGGFAKTCQGGVHDGQAII
ncbi:hypothetical protein [Streptomyces sp. JB150]|uniref:hypothetical protein n=1 Tax=Streptomyces sp. JB150 TaxID=2714844 RepID=UPI0014093FA4|nr:hypothetical protein [Streptomyces sp. JB150]QIJ60842.1 hypothetical protein G7Z13_01405 [Streptomyces sp. JB150]